MEEVDKIIIHSLKDIGCEISDEAESLEELTTVLIVEAAVRCLEIISPGLEIPKVLPQNMAARFQVGAAIATACKDLGYNGDVGYQTFLYSNVTDVRRVFMFLIEKLPREVEKQIEEPDDPLSKLKADIGRAVRVSLSRRLDVDVQNIPFISVPLETGITIPGVTKGSPQDWRDYCVNRLPFLTNQTTYKHTLPSIISLNAKGLIEPALKSPTSVPSCVSVAPKPRTKKNLNTWLSIHENIIYKKETTPIPAPRRVIQPKEEETSDETAEEKEEREKAEIEAIRGHIEELQTTLKTKQSYLGTVSKECVEIEANLKETAKEYEAHRKAIELLPKSGDNLKKLEEINSIAKQRLMTLATQWETHRKPLVEKYRSLKGKSVSRATESEKQMETIKDLKGKLDTLSRQIAVKQTVRAKLLEEYEQLPKNIKRSAYTRRIMEIIGNIKKQNDEIEKILRDTKMVQKETNVLTERLDRLFTVVDESIFRSAKDSKDEISKKAYKLLNTLQVDCGEIVGMVKETGAIVREIRDLEEQVEVESNKNVASNLARITADLQQMKSENDSLQKQLKE